jgi:hypothetical protein
MTKRSSIAGWTSPGVLALLLGGTALTAPIAHAQDADGDADIELGATEPSRVELSASSAPPPSSGAGSGYDGDSSSRSSGSSDTRLALQLRLDTINLLALAEPDELDSGPEPGRQLLTPLATAGVRFLDDGALFLGLGLGFANASIDNGPNELSQFGFSLSPLVSYDVLSDDDGALSLFGVIDLASLGETEVCNPGGCMDQNDDAFGIGVGLGAGLRGRITPGLAIGGELGWGFMSIDRDGADEGDFIHGIFANLLFEASVGI